MRPRSFGVRLALMAVVALATAACYPPVDPDDAYVAVAYATDEILATENVVFDQVVNDNDIAIDLRYDVYRPPGQKQRPVILLIHGGNFQYGNNTVHRPDAIQWARRGYVAVSATYRLASIDPDLDTTNRRVVEATSDIQVAIKHLRANAEEYNLDPSRIGVLGLSSGGLVGLLLTQDVDLTGERFDGPESHLPTAVFTTGAAGSSLIKQGLITSENSAVATLIHHYEQDPATGYIGDDARLTCVVLAAEEASPRCTPAVANDSGHYVLIGPEDERSADLIMPFLADELDLATAVDP